MHTADQKRQLRKDIIFRIEKMSENDRLAEGRTVSRILLHAIPEGSTICAFFPLKSEIDIRLFLAESLKRGDTLYLPVFKDKTLAFRLVTDLADLTPGELSIPEPPTNAPELTEQNVDVVLVPGRAFTAKGERLGRGSGGYDQWISLWRDKNPHTQFLGVCLECQLIQDIPIEEHDAMMDAIVTDRGMIELKN